MAGGVNPAAAVQPNVFDQSAGAYTNALDTAGQAARAANAIGGPIGFERVGAQQVAAPQFGSVPGVNAMTLGGPQQVQAQQIGMPSPVAAGQLGGMDLSGYMNPFQQQVTNQTLADMERARQMARSQDSARSAAAGAFGGSRHGLVEAETNRAFDDNTARTVAGLNMANFHQAQQGALADIGNRMAADQFNVGSTLQAGGMNQSAALQAALANQGAGIQTGALNQSAGLQAGLANQGAAMQGGMANMNALMQAGLANQGANLQAGSLNQGAGLQAEALRQAGLTGQSGQLANLAGVQGQLANLGFGLGTGATQGMSQVGGQQQALQQMLIDQIAGQFGGWAGSPQSAVNTVGGALGMTPGQNQTTTRQPGLFDYLALGATAVAGMCWVAREVYGADNPAWLEFREWLLTKAPRWLRRAYERHGPAWAAWVRRNPWSKRVLRPLMDAVR